MFLIATRTRVEGNLPAEVFYRRVQDAYLLLGAHKPAKYKNPIKDRRTHTALQANLIWHTDLHDYDPPPEGPKQKLMAFLDDASRMNMGCDLFPCKASCLTARVLGHTVIDGECAPYCVWSDNGGEFAGEFRNEMLRWRIVHKQTEPYNPEQNGKI
jgi:hypothetical protein